MNEVAEILKKIVGGEDAKMHVCVVDSVDGSTCDVTPISGDAPIIKVRLNADASSDLGLLITPKLNSVVLVCQLSVVDAFISMFSEIETISIKIGSSTLFIEDGEISFNGGNKKGLVEVDKMVSWMQKVHTDLTTLQSLLSSHPVAGNGAPLALVFTPQTSAPTSGDFENTKVKH